jgi:hypothetical protein
MSSTVGTVSGNVGTPLGATSWETPATFAERIWPVIDVYGRIRPLLATGERPAGCAPARGARPVLAIA